MNRRTLVQSLAIMPMAKHASLGIKLRSLESQFTLNDQVAVQMFLRAYSNSEAAESWRREWVGRAFLGLGEWYLDSTESVELPPKLAEMPGALHLHHYTAGVAAVKSSMLVGAFRRDHIACVMRMNGNAEGTMIKLAKHFASVPLPAPLDLAWNDVQLRAFIPTTESLGTPVVPDEHFWP